MTKVLAVLKKVEAPVTLLSSFGGYSVNSNKQQLVMGPKDDSLLAPANVKAYLRSKIIFGYSLGSKGEDTNITLELAMMETRKAYDELLHGAVDNEVITPLQFDILEGFWINEDRETVVEPSLMVTVDKLSVQQQLLLAERLRKLFRQSCVISVDKNYIAYEVK